MLLMEDSGERGVTGEWSSCRGQEMDLELHVLVQLLLYFQGVFLILERGATSNPAVYRARFKALVKYTKARRNIR